MVITVSILLSMTLYVLMQPGELLQEVSRYINLNIKNAKTRKLLLCPYCISGQLSLWLTLIDIHFILFGGDFGHPFLYLINNVSISILAVWFIVKIINRYL